MAGIALECFQQFPVVRYKDSLLAGLLPLATGRLADRFSRNLRPLVSALYQWNGSLEPTIGPEG